MDDRTLPMAHIREKDQVRQTLHEHLQETAEFSKQFASKIGLAEVGEILGWLHDVGKAGQAFQNYIASANGLIDPDSDDYVDPVAKKGEIDHSTAGAQMIYHQLSTRGIPGKYAAQILALCLASHHSGLIDCLSPEGENKFLARMEKDPEKTNYAEAEAYFKANEDERLDAFLAGPGCKQLIDKVVSIKEDPESQQTVLLKYGLLVRYLFSCLIDADRLSTADFENPGNSFIRNSGQYKPWEALIQRLEIHLNGIRENADKTEVNRIRETVSQSCLDFSKKPKGIYRLTVPTGGGKTLASLRFGLNHAAQWQMDRVFYVIPYTSIIDQNADEVRKILEDRDDSGRFLDRVVLEHHSNLTPEEETRRQNLLAENWDAPVVFTTQVQFLETLFSGGTRSARRMHQLANSVIIFDEVQTIPVRCVHLFNLALRFLVHDCGCTVILCTATQPLLDQVQPIERALSVRPEQHIIADEAELFRKLKRVEVFDRQKIGGWNDEEIAELVNHELSEKDSVLIVVNTRKEARSLYQTIAERDDNVPVYHLSTNMCPAHRLDVLGTVKEKLKNEKVICVSTQLIEAGVDIDFGAVIRYLAGLDSIVQAAGRCNRHGNHWPGNVSIVNPAEENLDSLKDIQIGIGVTLRILNEFHQGPERFDQDLLGLKALEWYYQYYFYERKDEMSYRVSANSVIGRSDNLFNLFSTNDLSVQAYQRSTRTAPDMLLKQSFRSAAKAFYVIDSSTRGVVVPYGDEGKEIINDLCSAFALEKQHKLLKRAQRYSVNLRPGELKSMGDMGAIHEVQEGTGIYYMDGQYYSPQFGWQDEIVNAMEFLTV